MRSRVTPGFDVATLPRFEVHEPDRIALGVADQGEPAREIDGELIRIIGERGVRIVPDVSVSGSGGASGVMEALTSVLLHGEARNLAARASAVAPLAVEAAKANGRA